MNRSVIASVLLVGATALAGCGHRPSLNALPAAGGVSGPTYSLSAEFDDALNLVIGARVKLDGAVIGQVTRIETKNYRAIIRLAIKADAHISTSATAQVRFTTPLGEDFIAISSPKNASAKVLKPDDVIPLVNTDSAPTIEDTFAALAVVLNGGGFQDLGTIIRELNKTLHGREPVVRDTLQRLERIVAEFDSRKGEFTRLLDSLNTLTTALRKGTGTIDRALTSFPAAFQAVAADTDRLIQLLHQVGSLSQAAQNVINRSGDSLVASMRALHPVLEDFVAARDDLLPTLNSLNAFGAVLANSAPGDYLNARATIQLIWGSEPITPPDSAYRNDPGGAATTMATVKVLLNGSDR